MPKSQGRHVNRIDLAILIASILRSASFSLKESGVAFFPLGWSSDQSRQREPPPKGSAAEVHSEAMPRSGGGSGAPLLHPDEQRPQFAPRQPLTPTAHDRGIGIQGARDTFDFDWRSTMTLIQIGCGQSPIAGWVNYDNSPSVRLAKLPPALIQLAGRLKLLDRQSIAYVSFCRANSIGHCNATRHIPWPDG